MITSAQLHATLPQYRMPPGVTGLTPVGNEVLDGMEAEDFVQNYSRITIVSDDQVFFLTGDHMFGHNVLPREFVPCSHRLPQWNTNRFRGRGQLISATELIDAYYYDKRQLHTLDELVNYVNERYP